MGYRPENLTAVNSNPAEVAGLTRRLRSDGLPLVNIAGQPFEKVTWGFGQVDVLSFDGLSNASGAVGDNLLLNAVYATTPRVLAFTILGGRENARTMEVINLSRSRFHGEEVRDSLGRKTKASHYGRIRSVLINATGHATEEKDGSGVESCIAHTRKLFWGRYLSTSGQPMVWAVAGLAPHVKGQSPKNSTSGRDVLPACLMAKMFSPGSLVDSGPCPAWTEEQAAACGYSSQELDFSRRSYPGRYIRREQLARKH